MIITDLRSVFRREKRVIELSEEAWSLLKFYAEENSKPLSEALTELIRKGLRYQELEKLYGKEVNDREVWDRRFYFLKIEAGYLYYRMRLRDVIEEMKRLVLMASSLISDLEICYRVCRNEVDVSTKLREVEKAREILKYYLEEYVMGINRELDEKRYVDDAEILNSIEDAVKRYKEVFMREKKG